MIAEMKMRRIEPDIQIVEITGSLRLGFTLTWMETEIRRSIKEGARKLIIDVTGLRYTDSAGLGMIISANGDMEQAGGQLRIAGAAGALENSFKIVHIDRVIPMDETVEVACKNLT